MSSKERGDDGLDNLRPDNGQMPALTRDEFGYPLWMPVGVWEGIKYRIQRYNYLAEYRSTYPLVRIRFQTQRGQLAALALATRYEIEHQ